MLTTTAILPDSKSLIIPFRAVNLYAVDLSVIRIFENNVLMFMQINSLASLMITPFGTVGIQENIMAGQRYLKRYS